MSITGLTRIISGDRDAGSMAFLVNFCHRDFNSCCITRGIHTSFNIGESVITMLPSSLVMHRLVLRSFADEDPLGL